MIIASALARQAAQRPGHVAIRCEDRTVTFGELHRRSNRTAHALRSAIHGTDARIGYLGRESEHYYEIALACAKLGITLVPVNWRLTSGEVAHILRDSRTELVFVEREFVRTIDQLAPDLADLTTVVHLDTATGRADGFLDWRAGAPDTDVAAHAGDQPIALIYTSGTTGLPKGVMVAERSFTVMAESGVDWVDWRPADVSLVAMPGFHLSGLSWFMQNMIAGVTNVVMRMFVSELALELIRDLGVTTTFVAPAMLQMLLDEPAATPAAFATLRKIVYGGAPITDELLTRCLGVFTADFTQLYASTETGNGVVCLPAAEHVPGSPRLRSAGRAFPNAEIKIVDPDGKPLPAGETGEVCIRTPARMLGYWGMPDATARTIRDGWVHMGDAGFLDQDGFLFLRDRVKDMIIVAGENIYPVEVETAVREHPSVADAAVVGVPDERWGEAVHASVVLRTGASLTARELTVFLRGKLADYKLPTRYEFVESLPRNPNGKVLRRVLREKFWQHLDSRIH